MHTLPMPTQTLINKGDTQVSSFETENRCVLYCFTQAQHCVMKRAFEENWATGYPRGNSQFL